MMSICVNHVGKAYKKYKSEWRRIASWFFQSVSPLEEQWILKDISFNVQQGESVGIVGRNGAGKSTLLKLITQTLFPTEGSIQVTGRVSAMLELGMGFNQELTGRQNAYHSLGLMGYSIPEIDTVIADVEDFAEIGEYFDRPVRMYSSGMQARVAFAVSTAFCPQVLIVDEVLSVGDAYFQAKCYERMAEFKKKKMTLLLVTHSTDDIVRHCDRAILLREGHLIKDGTPREISNLYFDDLFGKNRGKNSTSLASPPCKAGYIGNIIKIASEKDCFNTRPGYRKNEHRWGQGGAKILDYLIFGEGEQYPPQVYSNSVTDFFFKVKFDDFYENVCPGFLLKTLDGVFVYGTNSFIATSQNSNIYKISVSAGDVIVFHFSIPMSVNQGDYMISFGISSGKNPETLIPLDRRYDSVLIKVSNSTPFWGIADLNAKFDMEVQ